MTETLVGYVITGRTADGQAVTVDGDGRPLRLVRIRRDDRLAAASVGAWLGADGEHVQRIRDLGTAPDGDVVVVLDDLPIALATLLAMRALDAGEAVTVLVPLAEALARLHAAGIAHGAVGVAAVGLTEAGAPVLLLPRTATAATERTIAVDRRALGSLARVLLPPPVPDGVVAALERDPGGEGVDALFASAEPTPVLLDRRTPAHVASPPGRLLVPTPAATAVDEPPRRESVLPRLRGLVSGVRPRVWAAAAASLVALVAAIVLLPGRGAAAHDRSAAGSPTAVTARPVGPRPTPSATGASAPSPTAGPSDPVTAAARLLRARAACLSTAGVRCLDAVDEPGSPVDGLDRAAAAAGVVPGLPPDDTPVLLRTTGATAVLAVGPDTVLELRGPAGWRLRDVLAPAQMPSEPSKSPSSSRARTAERNRAASAPSTIRWS